MKTLDRYPHWVEWSEYDGVYVGRCPDLFFGGVDDPDDPVAVFAQLREAMREAVEMTEEAGRPLPEPSAWPGRDRTFDTPPGVPPTWAGRFEAEQAAPDLHAREDRERAAEERRPVAA